MKWIIDMAVRLLGAVNQIALRKWSYIGVSVVAFLASVVTLATMDLLPEPLPATPAAVATVLPFAASAATTTAVVAPAPVAELPVKIVIDKIGLSTSISNPETTDIELLDKALLKGAVRYPTSAKLGENGNVVLFGHSSYLPVVINKAYQAFNGIQKLADGDVVTVYSADTAYTYRVRTVEKESTLSAGIQLDTASKVLTLSTCNSFGATTDRYVVTADFVESHPISASA